MCVDTTAGQNHVKEENRQEIDALVARQYRTVNSSVKSDIVTPLSSSTVITCAEEVMFSPVVSCFDSNIAKKLSNRFPL